MKKKTLFRIQIFWYGIMIFVLFLGIFFSIKKYQSLKEYTFYNHARILVADQLNYIIECFRDSRFQNYASDDGDYPVVITDINGIVLYSENVEYHISDIININELIQIDQSFFMNHNNIIKTTFAVESNNTTLGFAAFFLPRADAIGMEEWKVILHIFLPVFISGIFCVIFLLLQFWYMKKRMIQPVNEMILSTKAIIDGNYNMAVLKRSTSGLMSNDIEKLSYNFELMRDELKTKREREEDLKRSQKELISCISHDLKTPISTIKAYSEGIRDGLANDPEKLQKYVDIIVNKSEVLTKMIHDLLEHSNAELNQLSINKVEQYFNPYIDGLTMEIRELLLHNHMEFIYENKSKNLLVDFDRIRITQVITNLIDNSIKYGNQENGIVGMKIDYLEHEKLIAIELWDNGNGIGTSDIPFVFDKFYRGEKSRSMSIPGSGLGLSICKYIVEAHSGEITCESRKEDGTKFTIYLPV